MGPPMGGVRGSHNFPLSDSERRKCAETPTFRAAHQSLTRIREAGESAVSGLSLLEPASTQSYWSMRVGGPSTWP